LPVGLFAAAFVLQRIGALFRCLPPLAIVGRLSLIWAWPRKADEAGPAAAT